MVSTTCKGICSTIGSGLHQLCLFSLFVFSNFSVYIISYLHNYDEAKSIRLEHGYFLGTLCSFTMNCTTSFGGYLDNKVGVHITIITGSLFIVLASTIFLFSTNLYLDYFIMILFGMGFGIACMTSFKNACCYFPKKQGLVTAIIGACGNMGASLWNFLGATIINPEQIQVAKGEFFPYEIAQKFLTYLYIHIGSVTGATILAVLFIFQYKTDEVPSLDLNTVKLSAVMENSSTLEDNETGNDAFNQAPPEEKLNITKQSEDKNTSLLGNTNPNPHYSAHIKKAYTSCRIWMLFLLFFSTSFGVNMISTTFFTFGTKQGISTTILTYTSVIYFISSCLIGFIWGYVFDKFGFKICILVINVLGALCSCSLYFAKEIPYLFAVLVIINGGVSSGTFSVLFPHILKVFTPIYSTETYGIVSMSVGCSSVISAIFAFCVTKLYEESNLLPYMFVYLLGTLFSIFGFIIGIFEDDKEFDYST